MWINENPPYFFIRASDLLLFRLKNPSVSLNIFFFLFLFLFPPPSLYTVWKKILLFTLDVFRRLLLVMISKNLSSGKAKFIHVRKNILGKISLRKFISLNLSLPVMLYGVFDFFKHCDYLFENVFVIWCQIQNCPNIREDFTNYY